MRSQWSSQVTRRHLRSHNRRYRRWYMVLSIKKSLSPEVIRFSWCENEVTRITWVHTTECITDDTWYFLYEIIHLRSPGSHVVIMRSRGSPEITQPNVLPVIHGTFYKKLVTWGHQVLLVREWGHQNHMRLHNGMYHRWHMVLSIRNSSPDVTRFSWCENEVVRITWSHNEVTWSPQFTTRHLRPHNRLYHRWYMVLSIKTTSPLQSSGFLVWEWGHQHHMRSHNRMYYRWYMVHSIRN